MDPSGTNPSGVSTGSCGHTGRAKRICDVCRSSTYVFTACSSACLQEHLLEHPDAPLNIVTRIKHVQKQMNAFAPEKWERYASHRASLMRVLPPAPGGKLCVFGAGSCSDIDLEELAGTFEQVHLVDLDGESMEQARDRQPESVRPRVVLHGDVDLSGFLNHLEVWGDDFPPDAALGPAAIAAATEIVRSLGQPFDVTLSTCVLSQLIQPYRQCWALPMAQWVTLDMALTGVHLATLAGATRSQGRGCLVFDVMSSDREPRLGELRESELGRLQEFAERVLDPSVMRPNPQTLLAQLKSPGLGMLFDDPQLTAPWLWEIRDGLQLVYGLAFGRP